MQAFSCLISVLVALPIGINAYVVDKIPLIGGGSGTTVTSKNPTNSLAPKSFIDRIGCRDGDRVDYLEVTHAHWSASLNAATGKLFKINQVFGYGHDNQGHDRGFTEANGGWLKEIKVWLCNPGGLHSGLVCGMSFRWNDGREPFMCGKQEGEANVRTFNQYNGPKAFVGVFSQRNDLAAIGWSHY